MCLLMSPSYGHSGKAACVQLWYHMYGKGIGTLNIYQQTEDLMETRIFTRTGDQGRLWRFAQATLSRVQPYRVSNILEHSPKPIICLN